MGLDMFAYSVNPENGSDKGDLDRKYGLLQFVVVIKRNML